MGTGAEGMGQKGCGQKVIEQGQAMLYPLTSLPGRPPSPAAPLGSNPSPTEGSPSAEEEFNPRRTYGVHNRLCPTPGGGLGAQDPSGPRILEIVSRLFRGGRGTIHFMYVDMLIF